MFDIHAHGISGYDTTYADPGIFLEIARLYGSLGVRDMLPTLYPAPIDKMRRILAAAKEAMQRQREEFPGSRAARILGVHLEGPFLNPVMAGALDAVFFRRPVIADCMEIISDYEDIVRLVTVAPELPGSLELIHLLTRKGITVGMGHSDATFDQARAGFQAGARGVTHIFNAMRGIHHREPGIAGFGIIDPDVYVEIIADPYHLSEEVLTLIFRNKSPDRVIVVSDMVRGSSGTHAVCDSAGRLKGGSIALPEAAQRLERLGIESDTLKFATSRNPYLYLGLHPSPHESIAI